MTTIEELFEEYAEVLDSMPTDYFAGGARKPGKEIAAKMLEAIRTGWARSDWLAHNKALKLACKRSGIATSADLRALVKGKEAPDA